MSTSQGHSSSRVPLYLGGGLATVGLLAGLVVEDGPVLCVFRRCTGGYCPGCGGTRAARALVSGDLSQSWAHHPWTVLVALQIAVLALITAVVPLRSIRPFARPVVLGNVGLGVGIWVVRLAAGSIPMPFS